MADASPASATARGMGVDLVTKSAACAKGEPEEFELVRAGAGAFREQLQAPLPHFRILLVCQQFDAIVKGTNRREQVMTETRTEKAGQFDCIHVLLHSLSLT